MGLNQGSFVQELGDAWQESPALWGLDELASALAARVAQHFSGGRTTDRADKPEWLFATVARQGLQDL